MNSLSKNRATGPLPKGKGRPENEPLMRIGTLLWIEEDNDEHRSSGYQEIQRRREVSDELFHAFLRLNNGFETNTSLLFICPNNFIRLIF